MSNQFNRHLKYLAWGLIFLPIWEAQGAPELRNPFAFPAGVMQGEGLQRKEGAGPEKVEKESAPVFRVTTILVSGQTKVAAINGVLLRKGEALNGYRVAEIEEKQVTLLRGKEKTMLKIDPEEKIFQKNMDSKNRVMGFPK
jgi:hypothetical protein